MKNSALKFLLLASLALNMSVIGTAGYMYFNQSGRGVFFSKFRLNENKSADEFLFTRLSLDHDQLKEMHRIGVPFHFRRDKIRENIRQKTRHLVGLIRAERPDDRAINAAISEISRMQEDLQKAVSAHIREISGKVDSGQRDKFFDLIEEALVVRGGTH